MKRLRFALAGMMMMVAATPLFAQGGCVNSPEAPTLVLAMVGVAVTMARVAQNRRRR